MRHRNGGTSGSVGSTGYRTTKTDQPESDPSPDRMWRGDAREIVGAVRAAMSLELPTVLIDMSFVNDERGKVMHQAFLS
ncbi:MAG: hypothetical protein AVDCRST_MAG43-458 [uncultured Thermomicrobiales bacterium]|uniref:Uncharacterized protein n=1 Tax=uncultured Thermomicrobiales bacterium TaxID=1645740 RepID=A0A6J4UCF1_9BACT|nr:MAG: hypothetical protein AVDCRST_MAG43-458 [uncultured Thermomicrobiales bacterium]